MQNFQSEASSNPRVVIFLTASAANDIPEGASKLACLLPLGNTTFAERIVESCSRAGLLELDLVISDEPESVRKVLGNGERWGMNFRWHLVKEGIAPYGVLRSLGMKRGQRLVLGHGHQWIHDSALGKLADADHVAVSVADAVEWCGWVSMDSLCLHSVSPHASYGALAEVAISLHARSCLMLQGRMFQQANSSQALLQAQELVLRDVNDESVPASWLRFSWGAMSPDARVDPAAKMVGPVYIGTGCTVGAFAELGPGAVLTRNVVVSGGAVVRDALILPNTYISSSVNIENAVASGNQIQHIRHGVRSVLPRQEAVIASLVDRHKRPASIGGKLIAGLLALGLLPAFLAVALCQWAQGHGGPWRSSLAAVGTADEGRGLQLASVRTPSRPDSGLGRVLGCYGAMLDVLQGRRCWFGVRPRSASEWYSLGPDWQALFSRSPIGLLHAPAWLDRFATQDSEALAVADAYFAVRTGMRERLRIVAALWRLRGAMYASV
jgi:hypothetical protein